MTLPARQMKALEALLMHPTIYDAAKASKVGERTLRRWLKQDDFHAEYLAARRSIMQQVTVRLQSASIEAANVLLAVMLDQQTPASSKIAAAKTTLSMAYRGIDLEDLALRVQELESRQQELDMHS